MRQLDYIALQLMNPMRYLVTPITIRIMMVSFFSLSIILAAVIKLMEVRLLGGDVISGFLDWPG